jgi:hypothetical protein
MEDSFEQQKYLSIEDRVNLAHRVGLSELQVKTWYQNRRTKWKHQRVVDRVNQSLNVVRPSREPLLEQQPAHGILQSSSTIPQFSKPSRD